MNEPSQLQLPELDWQAFAYVANELDEQSREAFEQRLENDPAACEALARAVELTTTIRAAESLTPAVSRRGNDHWQMRLSWLAMGAISAAILIAAVVIPSWPKSETTVAALPVSTELAIAWSSALPVVSPAIAVPQEAPLATVATDDHRSDVTVDFAAEDSPPSWMLAAIQGLAEESGDMNSDMNMNVNGPFAPESLEN